MPSLDQGDDLPFTRRMASYNTRAGAKHAVDAMAGGGCRDGRRVRGVLVAVPVRLVVVAATHATPDRWVVAAAFAAVTAGAVGAAGIWWASQEIQRPAGSADSGSAGPGPRAPAAGARSITAGGDISGIASAGDGATNIQR